MTPDCAVVPPNITVSQLIQEYILTGGRQSFLVADEGRLEGVLVLPNIKSISRRNWEVTQLKEIMTPVDKLRTAHPDQNALSILEQMDESEIGQMPVVSGGGVIGLITRDSLMRFLRIHSELGV